MAHAWDTSSIKETLVGYLGEYLDGAEGKRARVCKNQIVALLGRLPSYYQGLPLQKLYEKLIKELGL